MTIVYSQWSYDDALTLNAQPWSVKLNGRYLWPAWRASQTYPVDGADTSSRSSDATLTQEPRAETHRASSDHDQILQGPIRARPTVPRRQQDEGRASEGALLHDDVEGAAAIHAEGTRENCSVILGTGAYS